MRMWQICLKIFVKIIKGIFISTIQYLPEDADSSWQSSQYPQGSGQTEARGWWGRVRGRRGCHARRGGKRGRPAGGRSARRGRRVSGGRGMCSVCSTGSGTPGREEPGGIELRIKILVNHHWKYRGRRMVRYNDEHFFVFTDNLEAFLVILQTKFSVFRQNQASITATVPGVYMARYVMIFFYAGTSISRAIGRGGPWK